MKKEKKKISNVRILNLTIQFGLWVGLLENRISVRNYFCDAFRFLIVKLGISEEVIRPSSLNTHTPFRTLAKEGAILLTLGGLWSISRERIHKIMIFKMLLTL